MTGAATAWLARAASPDDLQPLIGPAPAAQEEFTRSPLEEAGLRNYKFRYNKLA
jgi:hypothetical protein